MTNEEMKMTGEALIALAADPQIATEYFYSGHWRALEAGKTPAFSRPDGILLHRIKPQPKPRLIRVDELPPVFWVKRKDGNVWLAVYAIGEHSLQIGYFNYYGKPSTIGEKDLVNWEYSPDRYAPHSFFKQEDGV